ncbi:MAG: hypothetical protein NUW00_01015 [Candidatus Kaiserbacteria bacterium]|nr:hypothetical protein [Candidatus Kaiserbacteria bacterium]
MQKKFQRSHIAMAMIAGAIVPIAVNALETSKFTPHHGTALGDKGKEIHSLRSLDIGDKTIVRTSSGQNHVYDTDEHDLMSAQRLMAKGYTVTPPGAAANS